MNHSSTLRFLVAAVGGLFATALLLMLVAFLNGVFFEEKDMITVTPCYFAGDAAAGGADAQMGCESTQVDDSGMARMFKSFLPKGSLSPAEQAVRDFKAQGADDKR
jgi:zona occludens toxin (predicted ATPase)